jgi:hypothetical protein
MTISTITAKVTVLGNGVQTTFNYNFEIPVKAQATLQMTSPAGITTAVPAASWSMTGAGSPTGGTFTYPASGAAPLATGWRLTLLRDVPEQQTTNLINQGGYYPEAVEGGLDNIMFTIQQLREQADRAILGAITETSIGPALPPAAQRASQLLGFDAAGLPMLYPAFFGGGGVPSDFIVSTGSTTPRSLQDRFAEWRNVKDFGAVGDGVTDDTAAIQAAQNAITSAIGGVLYFPPGRYKTSGPIVINRHGVIVQGCGRGQNNAIGSQVVTSGNHDGFQFGEFFYCGMIDMAVNGPGASTLTSVANALIRVTRATNFVMRDVLMLFGHDFLVLDGVFSGKFENITINQCTSDGSIDAHGVLLTDAAGRQCQNVNFRGLYSVGFNPPANAYGIRAFGGSTLDLAQVAVTTWNVGIEMQMRSTGATWPEFWSWHNCKLELNGVGWKIRSGTRITCVDCQVTLSNAGSGWEIGEDDTGQFEFIGCKAINNQQYGFYFYPTGSNNSSATMVGCVSSGNSQAGVDVYDGVLIDGFNNLTISGGRYGGGGYALHPGIQRQRYGVNVNSAATAGLTIAGADLSGNVTRGFNTVVTAAGAVAVVNGCRGYNPGLQLPAFTVAGVPSAASFSFFLIYVSNESGGAVPAFSDGTNWRRVTDRAIIS